MNKINKGNNRKGKKGDLAIGAILSILITVVGITLLLLFINYIPKGKTVYCNLANKYTPRFYENRLDSFCRGAADHTILKLTPKTVFLNKFSDDHKEEFLKFSLPRLKNNFSISIEREAMLLTTSLQVSDSNKTRKIRKFSSNEYNITLPPYPRKGGNHTVFINISKYVRILNASFDVYGDNYPLSIDLVFAIDTSGSMTEEWGSVCSIIKTIKYNLTKFGVKNLSLRVECIGNGKLCNSFFARCKTGVITKEDMKTVPISNFVEWNKNLCYENCKTWGVWVYHPADNYEEAWALASSFIARNFTWMNNSKRIVVLISDSDPTGASYTHYYTGKPPRGAGAGWLLDPGPDFTGNEEEAVENAIKDALDSDIYVTVVYGNLNPTKNTNLREGFNIGCSINPWDSCCTKLDKCNKVMRWMNRLAKETDGALIAYKDTNSLQESLLKAVTSRYPSGIKVEVGGSVVGVHNKQLNKENSPWSVQGKKLIKSIQDYLDNCEPDSTGHCLVPINVYSKTDGTISLKNLVIEYRGVIYNLSVRLEGDEVLRVPILYNKTVRFNFTDELKNLKRDCDEEICTFRFDVSVDNPCGVFFSNLNITYKRYFLKEKLMDSIVDCWKKSDFGRSEVDMFCDEIALPKDYVFFKPLSETDITKIIMDRQWCHIIGNSDFGCGEKDSIEFTKDINTITNILVEYNAKKKQVIIS